MIWRLAYALQGPRLVEIQTLQRDRRKYSHNSCRRHSPSPRPTIVNVCREAREEARREAQKAGHLLFATTPDAADIYFNPAIDTLYTRNEKEYWIRVWGPGGILTQYTKDHQPERLRHLAIEFDANASELARNTLFNALKHFRCLEDITFVVKEPGTKIIDRVMRLCRGVFQNGSLINLHRCFPVPRPDAPTRMFPECKLAVKRGALLEIIANAMRR
jgi:hypothetical protein